MSKKISRRDFLKLAGMGAATGAVLTGCGPASRYVVREPYTQMPEYTFNGQSTFFATTCRECPAGCGLVVRTYQGRAIKVEGNSVHPANRGKTCPRGQTTLQGLYNPDRMTGPVSQSQRGARNFSDMDWDAAVKVIADALSGSDPSGIAFLMGMAPDHLFDLVSDLAEAIGAPAPIRYGVLSMFEARATLIQAAESVLGEDRLPVFDIGNSDLVISFGANFLETWLAPVALTRKYSQMRKGKLRGELVQLEARMSQTGGKADDWIPLKPGTEGMVALAIGRLVAEVRGGALPRTFMDVDVPAIAEESGVSVETLLHLAERFSQAEHPIAIPGGAALGQSNGLATAEAILSLNALAGNFGVPGGVFLSPQSPTEDAYHRSATLREMAAFVEQMRAGEVQALFIHGVNPLFDLPNALGFEDALANVPLVVSFDTFPTETAIESDYVFPDHHGLESWGYQRIAAGVEQPTLSGAQPVVVPFYNTLSTVDVFLAAAAAVGGNLAAALPFADEVAFIQSKLQPLVENQDGNFNAADINTFFAYFQQYGGWWGNQMGVTPPAPNSLNNIIDVPAPEFEGEGEFILLPFVHPVLADSGANKPWLQEIPDPTTTVMWNSWVEINPEVGHELGLENDDLVRIVSDAGAVEVSVYLYPAIRPDTIAIPFGQGHKAYGRYAEGRGINPLDLLGLKQNEAGDLAFAGMKVRIEKVGTRRELARFESKIGVYGEGFEEEH